MKRRRRCAPRIEQFCANRPVLVAGSTAPGEERMVLTAYRNSDSSDFRLSHWSSPHGISIAQIS